MNRFTEVKLTADQRPKKLYTFWVTGRGDFPVDMLRYDRASPVTGSDGDNMFESRELRSVSMRSYHEPTIARWASFGWSVGEEARVLGEKGLV